MIFEEKKAVVDIKRYDLETVDYPVRVVSGQYDTNKDIAIFFVHGAPGASDNYYKYLQDSLLLSKANLYSIDRPGYGFSNFGKAETSIKKQTEVVAEIIDKLPEKNVVVLGHSFGGPIAAYSSLFSSKVKSVLMLAPAIDPENEKVFWFAYVSKWKLTKWMIPGAMGVAGDEKFTHVEELEKLKDIWKEVRVPIIHIHGTKDIVVPFKNLQFSVEKFDKQYLDTIVLQKENHFLPWKRYSLVRQELLKLIEKIK
ncbi:MAG: alpha/beta hydrolase [Flavobacteriaceae bacterium]